MFENIKLCRKGLDKYAMNIQSEKGKEKIFCRLDSKNKYDSEAIAVYTLNQKKQEIFLSYICKNNFEYTKEAIILYEDLMDCKAYYALHYYDSIEGCKKYYNDENWGKTEKMPIYTNDELKLIIKDINNDMYNFRFDYDGNEAYLFLNKKGLECQAHT